MEKYLEKKMRKYVIATLDSKFLARDSLNDRYCFTDIVGASKYKSRNMGLQWIDYYRRDTGDLLLELVVIPVDISYELINENSNVHYRM